MTIIKHGESEPEKGERISKRLARAGVCSRRDAERLIAAGRVSVNGTVLETPARNVTAADQIFLDGKLVAAKEAARLWRYHKPSGLVTTHRDEKGRTTIFDTLPKSLPRVISVGRLDLNSEGLLLLTNDGELARHLELPSSELTRTYRVRVFGKVSQARLDRLADGVVVEGVAYGPIAAKLDSAAETQGKSMNTKSMNIWLEVSLKEGKNREVRRVLAHLGLQVNRLIRVSYGPFSLGDLAVGAVKEVKAQTVQGFLGEAL